VPEPPSSSRQELVENIGQTVALIHGVGGTITCPVRQSDSCVRDAERKGFVKLSNALAGIKVDWKAKPLRIVEVRGTAAEAGVKTGDILVALDGNKIVEPLSIFMLMGSKEPGQQLKVRVMRDGKPLDFVYDVMPK
jgi:S1-C subfamily serine protease